MPYAGLIISSMLLNRHASNYCHKTPKEERYSKFKFIRIETMKRKQRRKKKIRTQMISADLQCLRLPHDKANLASDLVLQELDASRTPLLPLIPLFVKSVKLRFSTKLKQNQIISIRKPSSKRIKLKTRNSQRERERVYRSRIGSSSSSPVETATSSSLTMGAIWAPVSSSSAGALSSSSLCSGSVLAIITAGEVHTKGSKKWAGRTNSREEDRDSRSGG